VPHGGEGDTWSSAQVGDLLAMLPLVDPARAREALRGSLAVYLNQLTAGNILAMAEYIHCPPSILRNWLDGTTVPTLECVGPVCSDRFFGFLSGIIARRNRGGGNVKISFIDFQGLWKGRKTALSFSALSTDRHFHGRLRCALCRPC
jgi:hypothetical protein